MYVKTKRARLENAKTGTYYYLAKSERKGKQVYPKIIKYLGKEIPKEHRRFYRKKCSKALL